jgi:hypothetical protein
MYKRMNCVASAAVVLGFAGIALAQQAQPAPAAAAPAPPAPTTPASETKLNPIKIVIKEVTGRVRYQLTPDGPKTIAKIGDELREGVKVSIAVNSKVTLLVGDGQLLTFEQLGNFVITDAVNDGKVDITRIDVSQGRVAFDVKKVRFANDVIIRTPDMTLAIKGTTGSIEHVPGRPTLATGDRKNTGLIVLDHLASGRKVQMTGNERSNTAVADPALNLALRANVDTATESARERDEVRVIKRTEGSGQSVQLDVGDTKEGMRIDLNPNIPLMPTPGKTKPRG